MMPSHSFRDGINATVVAILTVSTLLQCIALLGVFPIAANTVGRHVFSTVEMLLIVLLLFQGWRIKRWSVEAGQNGQTRKIAHLCFYSLLLCGLGDFVNRNYFELYYQWDNVIKHSVLIQSIGFFLPGYFLLVLANWEIGGHGIRPRTAALGIAIALMLGALVFMSGYDPRVNGVASTAILIYTLMHALLILSTGLVIRAYGWTASSIVVIGLLLAPLADVLLSEFMIKRDHYPVIAHVNWIIYFTSLAMIQQMPFLAARRQ